MRYGSCKRSWNASRNNTALPLATAAPSSIAAPAVAAASSCATLSGSASRDACVFVRADGSEQALKIWIAETISEFKIVPQAASPCRFELLEINLLE